MDEFDPYISINSSKSLEDTNLVIKEISIDHGIGKVETPFKVIDVSKINLNLFNDSFSSNNSIIETIKYINQYRSFNSLYKILESPESNQKASLDKFFKINSVFRYFNSIISLSFSKNPFEDNKFKSGKSSPISYEGYEFLLDYIHECSTSFLLVPNINFNSFDSMVNYEKYIEKAVNTFSSLNSKPIFVPVSMNMNNKQMDDLMEFYKSKNYSNIWCDFNATNVNTKVPQIRYLFRKINKFFGKNYIIYFSHLKKEINRNINDILTKPSDALSPLMGCDILGANRESNFGGNKPKMTPAEKEKFNKDTKLNQNRIFDPSSYYYCSLNHYPDDIYKNNKKILEVKGLSNVLNSNILNQEMSNIKEFAENNNRIIKYLNTKKIFRNEEDLKNNILNVDENQSILSKFFPSNYI